MGPPGMGGPPGAPPMGGPPGMGGDPMGGMGGPMGPPPPMGGPPMGGDPMGGGMGGPPGMGGMPPGGGSMQQVTVDMKDADVWTVLEKILDSKHHHSKQPGASLPSNGNMLQQPQPPAGGGFLMN